MFKKAVNLIEKSNNIVIVSHKNPDADTIGSMLGLGISLKTIKKKVFYFNIEKELPKKFDFLPSYSKIKNNFPKYCDLVISVDCGSFDRIGIPKKNFSILNIDHHKTNTLFGDVDIINKDYASTSMVVFELLKYAKYKISPECATCLYAALAEDSGYFKFDRVNAKTFENASELINFGAKPNKIANLLTNRNSLAKLRLMQIYLSSMELKKYAKVCICRLSIDDFKKSGALISDSENLVQIGLSLATVELSIFMYELQNRQYKISLRSKNGIDCSEIAIYYGGGGHKKSAGFTVDLKDIDDIIDNILKKVDR